MKKLFIFIMVLFCSAWLFAEEEPSSDELEIEDYKRALKSSRSRDFTIHEFEEFAALETGEKFFLCKWSATSKNIYFSLFALNKNHEFLEHTIGLSLDDHIIEVLTSGLSGIRIWQSPATIGDFNNDGYNEIAALILRGSAYTFWILGIDPDIKDVVYYFNDIFYVDWPPTFTPVEFMKYKGMDGFKMLRIVPSRERASIKYPFQGNKSISWFFYTWDEGQRKFVEIEEFVEGWEETYVKPSQPFLAEQNTDETPVFTESDSGKSSLFNLYIGIAVGVIALAVAAVFVVRRKKG